MTYSLFDVIKLTVNLPEYNLSIGMVGAIIDIYENPFLAYEVEFCDENGHTLAQLALTSDQFEAA
jgi:hypothetical protein